MKMEDFFLKEAERYRKLAEEQNKTAKFYLWMIGVVCVLLVLLCLC